jgi:hypothetical protein
VTVNMYSWKQGPFGPIEHGTQWLLRCVDEWPGGAGCGCVVEAKRLPQVQRPFNVASSVWSSAWTAPGGGTVDSPRSDSTATRIR